jgi:plasmid stability protein
MNNTIPLSIVAAADVAPALRLRAEKEGRSPAAVVNAILRQALAAEMAEAAGSPSLADVIQDIAKTAGRTGGPTASYRPLENE